MHVSPEVHNILISELWRGLKVVMEHCPRPSLTPRQLHNIFIKQGLAEYVLKPSMVVVIPLRSIHHPLDESDLCTCTISYKYFA